MGCKGRQALHERDDAARGARWSRATAPARVLFRLLEAAHPGGAEDSGFWLHPRKDDRAGQWGVRVSGNWRLVFRFEDGGAVTVDLIGYY